MPLQQPCAPGEENGILHLRRVLMTARSTHTHTKLYANQLPLLKFRFYSIADAHHEASHRLLTPSSTRGANRDTPVSTSGVRRTGQSLSSSAFAV